MEPTTIFIIISFIAFAFLSYVWTAREMYKLFWFGMTIFAFCLLATRYVEWKDLEALPKGKIIEALHNAVGR
jgi:hypothetical protein